MDSNTSAASVELQGIRHVRDTVLQDALQTSHAQSNASLESSQHHLEPTDRGFAAWRLLGAAFVFEALLWGFPLSFGVFQNYYSQLPEFAGNPYIPVVGTVASGISYLGAPLIIPVIKRYPKHQRHMIWIGWPICIMGLAAGSFATNLGSLIITQGVMYGIGFLIFYYPILSFVNEFWVERRGMAYGLLCSASGVSGVAMPFIVDRMLNRYGYPTTLRAISIAMAVLTGPLIPLLKGRLPPASQSGVAKTDWTFLRKPLFWVYSFSNIVQGLGYFFPSLYIPSYAASIGVSSTQGALLLALLSVSQVFGQFCFGYLSDRRLGLNLLLITSTFVAGAAVFALWGLARSIVPLVAFSLVYGFFGAGYVAMWARMGSAISEEPTTAYGIFGLFCFGKGIGNVAAGPLGALLLSSSTIISGGSSELTYKVLIWFTGTCMLCSGISIIAWYMRIKY